MQVDLNCDLGESFGAWQMGNDAAILPMVSSINVACGFHAGDPSIMRQTVAMALEHNVAIGAHPGLPDLAGFGRRNMAITPQEAYNMVVYQVGALNAFVQAAGGTLHHVKPHGALYNMAAKDATLARAIAQAVKAVGGQDILLYGLANSALIAEGQALGLKTANEVFADRSYQADGSLTPRSQSGALIENDDLAVAQVLKMVQEGKVVALTGEEITIKADTVCIHGDGPHALSFAQKVRAALLEKHIQISA